MKVAVVQTNPEFGEVAANLDAVERQLKQSEGDVDVFVLPELFQTGYLFLSKQELRAVAEPVDASPTLDRLHDLAKQHNAAIAAGFAEASADGVYNSSVLMGPRGVLSIYRKIHLFHEEKLYFQPGDRPFEVVEFRGARMGLMICFDWRFPESTRSLALLGADIILHPSNLVLPWCPAAMITRAQENNLYTATANRWGVEDRGGKKHRYIGQSQIVGPRGDLLVRAGEEEDAILSAEIDLEFARNKQVGPHNNLWEDRREEFYVRASDSP